MGEDGDYGTSVLQRQIKMGMLRRALRESSAVYRINLILYMNYFRIDED